MCLSPEGGPESAHEDLCSAEPQAWSGSCSNSTFTLRSLMNAKNVGKYLVSALLLFQVTFPIPKTVYFECKVCGYTFCGNCFSTHHVRVLTREDPRVQWMWKGLHSPLFVWPNRIHAGEKPFEYKNIREPFVIAPPWFHMGRLTWGRNVVNLVNVDSLSAFIHSFPSLRVFILGRNPLSVRNGPKPFTCELVSGTVRELILGKDLLNVTPGENLLNRGSFVLWGIIPKRNKCSYAVRKSSEISRHLLSLEESYRKWIHLGTLHLRVYKGERTSGYCVVPKIFNHSSTLSMHWKSNHRNI